MSNLSNLSNRELLKKLKGVEVGTEDYIRYKGTLLFRHWYQKWGEKNAKEMHEQWVAMWKCCEEPGQPDLRQLQLPLPAEE